MPDLPFVPQQRERADLVGQRHGGVDPVQLQQVGAQSAQAQLRLLAQAAAGSFRPRAAARLPCGMKLEPAGPLPQLDVALLIVAADEGGQLIASVLKCGGVGDGSPANGGSCGRLT